MKQLLFIAAFFLSATVAVNAQTEGKTCDKPCTHTEKASAQVDNTMSKAIEAANSDQSIEVRTCEKSGNVSFYKKDVCENSGKVSFTEMEYQESTGEFAVKASNDEVLKAANTEKKSSCSGEKAKACCSSKAAKASASVHPQAGCCSSSAKKSCGEKS